MPRSVLHFTQIRSEINSHAWENIYSNGLLLGSKTVCLDKSGIWSSNDEIFEVYIKSTVQIYNKQPNQTQIVRSYPDKKFIYKSSYYRCNNSKDIHLTYEEYLLSKM